MIFNVNEKFDSIESYKERNLYYKIFAGYLFNELIPDLAERKDNFMNLLTEISNEKDRSRGDNILSMLEKIKKEKLNVTFDFHSSQIIKEHKKIIAGKCLI